MITVPGEMLTPERERRKNFTLLTQLIELDEDAWKSVIGDEPLGWISLLAAYDFLTKTFSMPERVH